jgi:hypothetical protein
MTSLVSPPPEAVLVAQAGLRLAAAAGRFSGLADHFVNLAMRVEVHANKAAVRSHVVDPRMEKLVTDVADTLERFNECVSPMLSTTYKIEDLIPKAD